MFKKLILTLTLVCAGFTQIHALSLDYVKRGFQNCTGYCDQKNIKCDKGINKQGYYDWCKQNCIGARKTNLDEFVDAIGNCDTANRNNSSSKTQQNQGYTQNSQKRPLSVIMDLKTLELPENATLEQVKKQYRALSLKYHTDKNMNTTDASQNRSGLSKDQSEEKFIKINQANQNLVKYFETNQ